jgi:16S rRNA (guanine527-N7)-methyltransferase
MTFPELYIVLLSCGTPLSDRQKEQLESFYFHLVKSNKTINLISRKETEIISRHFLNCALIRCLKTFHADNRVLDIGSGGGFPAMIMAILYPDVSFVMVESIRKKSEFLETTSREIGLENVAVIRDRVEKLSGEFDFITCRAVAPVDQIVRWSSHLLKPEGEWILWKGRNYREEIESRSLVIHDLERLHSSQNGVLLFLRK